ncbi:hypothetical protein D3C75_1229310 [compost metagenome]
MVKLTFFFGAVLAAVVAPADAAGLASEPEDLSPPQAVKTSDIAIAPETDTAKAFLVSAICI